MSCGDAGDGAGNTMPGHRTMDHGIDGLSAQPEHCQMVDRVEIRKSLGHDWGRWCARRHHG
jgi:hypothetical protein